MSILKKQNASLILMISFLFFKKTFKNTSTIRMRPDFATVGVLNLHYSSRSTHLLYKPTTSVNVSNDLHSDSV